ncbi:MAG: PAS domain-containing protein [Methanomicrobiales archaeon]|nr:PAS domain-containing protein [Methanomicrobiales archaeon]
MIRVLLVDADRGAAELLVLFLEKSGAIRVDTVASPFEARERVQTAMYDAIVLDTAVCAGDLIPFLRDVRPLHPSAAIILQTHRGDEPAALAALNAGADFTISTEGDPAIRFAHLYHILRQAVGRHTAQAALQKSEERYRSFFDNFKGIAFELRMDGTPVFLQGAVERITGYPPEMLLQGKVVWRDLVHRDDRERVRDANEKVRARPSYALELEYRIRRFDGTVRWVHEQMQNVADHLGVPVSIQGTIFDITKRREAEEAVRESRERLQRLANNVQDIIFRYEVHPQRRFSYMSPAVTAITGYTPDEFYADATLGLNVVHPDDKKAFKALFRGDIPKTTPVQLRRIRKDGRVIWTEELDVPVYGGRGRLIAVEGVIRDITARKRAEDALRENEERLNLAIEGAGIGIWDLNLKTGEQIFNRRWLERLGYSPDAFILAEDAWERIIHPDDRQRVQDATRDHLDGTTPFFAAEFRVRTSDGRWKWMLSLGRARYRNRDGEPYRMAGILIDITETHDARTALQEANKKLNLLAEITRHDILNKLTGMFGYLYLIDEILPADEQLRMYFQRIWSLADTIQRQITFTRDYQNLGMTTPVWQNVGAVVRQSALSVPMMNVRLVVETGTLEILADPLLEKVFYNILDNAVRHGEHVTGIYVRWEERGDRAVITLEDNGIGVPDDEKETIFEKGVGRNTGLGLFLSREILGITGITIAETGTEGQGARFEILVAPGGFRLHAASSGDETGDAAGPVSRSVTP